MFQFDRSKRRWQRAAGGLFALVVSLGLVGGALAGNSVNTKVVGGTRSASIADLSLGNVSYAHVDQTKSGTMTLTADDSTGTGAGWNVTVVSSNFVYTGSFAGTDIPAANFALTAAATPVKTAGQGVTPPGGPMVPATSPVGTLNVARKVVQANANFGKGTYTQGLDVSLLVPADSLEGTYTGTETVTITAGP